MSMRVLLGFDFSTLFYWNLHMVKKVTCPWIPQADVISKLHPEKQLVLLFFFISCIWFWLSNETAWIDKTGERVGCFPGSSALRRCR